MPGFIVLKLPTPCIEVSFVGAMTVAHGKYSNGILERSFVWCPYARTLTRPNLSGSLLSSTTPINQTNPSRPEKCVVFIHIFSTPKRNILRQGL